LLAKVVNGILVEPMDYRVDPMISTILLSQRRMGL
jgi:hypothetical protein